MSGVIQQIKSRLYLFRYLLVSGLSSEETPEPVFERWLAWETSLFNQVEDWAYLA